MIGVSEANPRPLFPLVLGDLLQEGEEKPPLP